MMGCGKPLPDGWLYTTGVGSTAATVAWTGGGDADVACVGPGRRTVSAPTTHWSEGPSSVRLQGLLPLSRYVCRVASADGTVRRRLRFRTAPGGPASFRFAVVG